MHYLDNLIFLSVLKLFTNNQFTPKIIFSRTT